MVWIAPVQSISDAPRRCTGIIDLQSFEKGLKDWPSLVVYLRADHCCKHHALIRQNASDVRIVSVLCNCWLARGSQQVVGVVQLLK